MDGAMQQYPIFFTVDIFATIPGSDSDNKLEFRVTGHVPFEPRKDAGMLLELEDGSELELIMETSFWNATRRVFDGKFRYAVSNLKKSETLESFTSSCISVFKEAGLSLSLRSTQ